MAIIPGIYASQISGHLQTGNYFKIATVTAAGGETSLSFNSIPGTYKHLQIRGIAQDTYNSVVGSQTPLMQFNGDIGTNYAFHYIWGLPNSNFAGASGSATSNGINLPKMVPYGLSTSIFGVGIIDIVDYANTNKNKTVKCIGGLDANITGGNNNIAPDITSGLWMSTSAITSITINKAITSFFAGSTFTLYGVN